MSKQWYHNGPDTVDNPQIRRISPRDKELGLFPSAFSEGPFATYSDAKRDLLRHYRDMQASYAIAIKLSKQLKKG